MIRVPRSRSIATILLLPLLLIGCRDAINDIYAPPVSATASLFAINGSHSVTLGWTYIAGEAPVKLMLFRGGDSTFSANSGTLIASLPGNATKYVDAGLTNGWQYFYRLQPMYNGGAGRMTPGTITAATPGSPMDYSSIGEIEFSSHIRPIFQSGCAVSGCHDGNTGAGSGTDKFSLKNWEDLFVGGDHGAILVPYRANLSHLLYHINIDTLIAPVSAPHMPLNGFNIPPDQISTLIRWINGGASNDYGAVALSAFPNGKVLATNQAADVVSVIDIKTLLVARYVQAGLPQVTFGLQPESPHNITIDAAHDLFYVNLVSGNKIIKYRLSTLAKLGELTGVISPTQVALSVTGDTGYVAQFNETAHAVRIFDTRTMTLFPQAIGTLLMSKPHGVAMTPDARQLVITGNLSDNLVVTDVATGALSLVWLDPNSSTPGTAILPYQTVMTPDNKYIYVTCQRTNDVRVVDRDSMKVTKIIPVGTDPLIAAITPDGQFIYVANRNTNNVSVIRTSDQTVSATINNIGPQPHGVAIDKAGRFAYVTCENSGNNGPAPHHPTEGSTAPGFIVVIDIRTNTVVHSVEVQNFAAGIAVVE